MLFIGAAYQFGRHLGKDLVELKALLISSAVTGLLLSACNASAVTPVSDISSSSAVHMRAFSKATPSPLAYVAEECTYGGCSAPNGMVEVIGKGTTITSGIDEPNALAMDKSGNLYVGSTTSADNNGGYINVFSPGGTTPARKISNLGGTPLGLAVNAAGQLYSVLQVRIGGVKMRGKGLMFKAGASTPSRTLQGLDPFSHDPAFDDKGNFYVANFFEIPGSIGIYKRGANIPSRVLIDDIKLPTTLVVRSNGEAVVLSLNTGSSPAVLDFEAGESSPSLTITEGLSNPIFVAVDTEGNIYVANSGESSNSLGSVVVYRHGQQHVWRTIRKGVDGPVRLGFDGEGRLYVANSPNKRANSIAVYASNGSTPIATYPLKEDVSQMLVPQ